VNDDNSIVVTITVTCYLWALLSSSWLLNIECLVILK